MRVVSKVLVFGIALSMLAVGCKKKEEQPVPTAPMQAPAGMQMPAKGPGGPKVDKKVVVPEDVKNKWKQIKLLVESKATKKASEYTIKLGSDFEIPNTKLKVTVGEFLPDFKMGETEFTSASSEPNNPAVRVEIFEDGKSVFKGWLYSKFPTMHPFEHEKYGIILKEGVKG